MPRSSRCCSRSSPALVGLARALRGRSPSPRSGGRRATTADATASAIVVMGAAQWNGTAVARAQGPPRPRRRRSYRAGRAGDDHRDRGQEAGDRVTQGVTGYDYLRGQGIPERAIKVEVEGTNSYEELSAAAIIIGQAGPARRTCCWSRTPTTRCASPRSRTGRAHAARVARQRRLATGVAGPRDRRGRRSAGSSATAGWPGFA